MLDITESLFFNAVSNIDTVSDMLTILSLIIAYYALQKSKQANELQEKQRLLSEPYLTIELACSRPQNDSYTLKLKNKGLSPVTINSIQFEGIALDNKALIKEKAELFFKNFKQDFNIKSTSEYSTQSFYKDYSLKIQMLVGTTLAPNDDIRLARFFLNRYPDKKSVVAYKNQNLKNFFEQVDHSVRYLIIEHLKTSFSIEYQSLSDHKQTVTHIKDERSTFLKSD